MSGKSKGSTIIVAIIAVCSAIILFGGAIVGTMFFVSNSDIPKEIVTSTSEDNYNIDDLKDENKEIEYSIKEDEEHLTGEIENKKERNKADIQELLENFHKEYDDMEQVTWYRPKGEENFLVKNETESFQLYPYVGVDDLGNKWCRVVLGFSKEGWVFFDQVTIKADDEINKISVSYQERNNDVVYAAGIHEWSDLMIDRDIYSKLKPLIDSKDAKIRFSGDTEYTEYIINSQQKTQLKDVLKIFELIENI